MAASWRLVPNRVRNKILRLQGWTIGTQSNVLWGIIPTTRNVTIGRYCAVSHHAFFDGGGAIVIEDHARLGSFVSLLTTTHPIEPNVIRRKVAVDDDRTVVIGRGSWLASRVTVLPGVHIAPGCVIGAGAVVTKSTEPNGLYAGNPAKLIRVLPTAADEPTTDERKVLTSTSSW